MPSGEWRLRSSLTQPLPERVRVFMQQYQAATTATTNTVIS